MTAQVVGDKAVSVLNSTNGFLSQGLDLRDGPGAVETAAGSSCDEDSGNGARRKRELLSGEKKDEDYWDKRRKNNEAAKRSREKRRANDLELETRVLGLLEENARLRAELLALKFRFGLVKDPSDAPILPLSDPACAQTRPDLTHYYNGPTDGHSRFGSCRIQAPGLDQGSGLRTAGPTWGASDSRVYFDARSDGMGPSGPAEQTCGSHAPRVENHTQDSAESLKSLPHKLRFKGPAGSGDGRETSPSPDARRCGPPVAMVGPNMQSVGRDRQENDDGQRKLHEASTFGCHNCSFPQNSDDKRSAEDTNLGSQIRCLSQEVAQLKRLFSNQLHSKIS
ncbi:unnamed protein product [Menidia menidia]|uniref:(Atlantic silverside) hypothetical protein n=1 Tax=Menidia menidia TaxID=238744 RepID=A0A8S4B9X3_9TELE|nr:unnamed protein product [Menidia menidia]